MVHVSTCLLRDFSPFCPSSPHLKVNQFNFSLYEPGTSWDVAPVLGLGVIKCRHLLLAMSQSPTVFCFPRSYSWLFCKARCNRNSFSWHLCPRQESMVWGLDPSLLRGDLHSQAITLIYQSSYHGYNSLSRPCLHPSYSYQCGFFITLVIGILFSLSSGGS